MPGTPLQALSLCVDRRLAFAGFGLGPVRAGLLAWIGCWLSFSQSYGQSCPGFFEPDADTRTSARVVGGSPGVKVILMDGSSATADSIPSCLPPGTLAGHSVWFEVTPAVTGPLSFTTCHPATSYDTVVEAWMATSDPEFPARVAGGCEDNADASLSACANTCGSGRGATVSFDATAGRTYWFQVSSFNNNSANCNPLCLGVIVTVGAPCGDAPINSTCALARELPGTPGTHEVELDVSEPFAFPSEPQPLCVNPSVGHSAWFKVTPTVSGPLTFTTCHPNTSYDTVVQAHESCGGFYSIEHCNDNTDAAGCDNACGTVPAGSTVSVDGVAGSTYYFHVGSSGENELGCRLCLGVRLTVPTPDATPPSIACSQDVTVEASLTCPLLSCPLLLFSSSFVNVVPSWSTLLFPFTGTPWQRKSPWARRRT